MSESGNTLVLFLPLELQLLIRKQATENEQLSATFILKLLVEHYKDKLIEHHGKEFYDSLIAKYSLTALEQKELKKLRQLDKEGKKQLKIDKLLTQKRFWQNILNDSDKTKFHSNAKTKIEKIEFELKALGYES